MIKIDDIEEFRQLDDEFKKKISEIIDRYNDLGERLDILDLNTKYDMRFQDYYDVNKTSEENIGYFKEVNHQLADVSIIKYLKYILDKTLEDLLLIIEEPEFGVDELVGLFDEKEIFSDAIYLLDNIEMMLTKENGKLDLSKLTNYVVPFSDTQFIFDFLTKNNTGSENISIDKSMSAINTICNVSYSNPELSGKIHKVVDNSRDHDIRITDHNILLERYSTSGSTKVIFLKMPILKKIRKL